MKSVEEEDFAATGCSMIFKPVASFYYEEGIRRIPANADARDVFFELSLREALGAGLPVHKAIGRIAWFEGRRNTVTVGMIHFLGVQSYLNQLNPKHAAKRELAKAVGDDLSNIEENVSVLKQLFEWTDEDFVPLLNEYALKAAALEDPPDKRQYWNDEARTFAEIFNDQLAENTIAPQSEAARSVLLSSIGKRVLNQLGGEEVVTLETIRREGLGKYVEAPAGGTYLREQDSELFAALLKDPHFFERNVYDLLVNGFTETHVVQALSSTSLKAIRLEFEQILQAFEAHSAKIGTMKAKGYELKDIMEAVWDFTKDDSQFNGFAFTPKVTGFSLTELEKVGIQRSGLFKAFQSESQPGEFMRTTGFTVRDFKEFSGGSYTFETLRKSGFSDDEIVEFYYLPPNAYPENVSIPDNADVRDVFVQLTLDQALKQGLPVHKAIGRFASFEENRGIVTVETILDMESEKYDNAMLPEHPEADELARAVGDDLLNIRDNVVKLNWPEETWETLLDRYALAVSGIQDNVLGNYTPSTLVAEYKYLPRQHWNKGDALLSFSVYFDKQRIENLLDTDAQRELVVSVIGKFHTKPEVVTIKWINLLAGTKLLTKSSDGDDGVEINKQDKDLLKAIGSDPKNLAANVAELKSNNGYKDEHFIKGFGNATVLGAAQISVVDVMAAHLKYKESLGDLRDKGYQLKDIMEASDPKGFDLFPVLMEFGFTLAELEVVGISRHVVFNFWAGALPSGFPLKPLSWADLKQRGFTVQDFVAFSKEECDYQKLIDAGFTDHDIFTHAPELLPASTSSTRKRAASQVLIRRSRGVAPAWGLY